MNQISIDDNGDYLASCSDDGRVVINGLYNTENNQVMNFDRPVKAVAMDPDFYKSGSGKHFVTGDDKLVMNEKGFWSRYRSLTLHQGEGPIRNIKWKSHFIAWANDHGVKVYDVSSKRRITHITKDDSELRPELHRCNLCWKDSRTLIIGWGSNVKVCVVKERAEQEIRDLPHRYVEIVYQFRTDFHVAGIAPYDSTNLIVLSYDEEGVQHQGGRLVAPRPTLRIIVPHMDYFIEESNDALSIRGFPEYRCNDYHLEYLLDENVYYIVSAKDIVLAKQRDMDDHVSWLLDREEFQDAMNLAKQHETELKKHNYQDIGKEFLDWLLAEDQFDHAAQQCTQILGRNKELWEQYVYKFAQIKQLKSLSPYLPRGEPKLNPGIYEMVLNEFLQTDFGGFLNLIKEWPSDLYNIQTLVNAVLDKLDRHREDRILLQCLGELYTYDKRYDKALDIYLRLKHNDVFQLIHKHNLFDTISDKILLLMDFDLDMAVKMLLDNIDKISIGKVVKQLSNAPQKFLHVYLDKLFEKDVHEGRDYHGLQVKLYAEYDRPRLLSFLKSSTYYPLQAALEECQTRHLIPEMVFLLGRMGNTKKALLLIINELQDVNRAIEFCKEQNDQELWDDLIDHSMDQPAFITGLLNNIGTHVDPTKLIKKIREGLEIPGLRDSLVRILQDYNLQISLREGCKKILVADCFNLFTKLMKTQKKAVSLDGSIMCQICQEKLLVKDLRYASNVLVFYCKHAFHEDCVPAHAVDSCSICSAQIRAPAGFMSRPT